MSAAKHTPGPWEVQTNRLGEGLINRVGGFVIDSKSVNERVCSTWSTNRADIDDKANAALIAAAPTMLESLRGVVRYMKNETDNPTAVYDQVKQAIAKAEGR